MNSTAASVDSSNAIRTIQSDLDTFLVLNTGFLIFFMQGGFAMLETGFIQAARARNILFKNLLDVCVSALCWYSFGYGVAFGVGNGFVGQSHFFITFPLYEAPPTDSSSVASDIATAQSLAHWFFQFSFAVTATTIVSGAIAERVKFQGYLLFSAVFTLLVYPFCAHWLWGTDGWLRGGSPNAVLGGALDFAGGLVVHTSGGVAALCGAYLVGYRNKYSMNRAASPPRFEFVQGRWIVNQLAPSSEVLAALGVFIMWLGWYGFNTGSLRTFQGINGSLAPTMALITINTLLSPCVSALVAIFIGLGQRTRDKNGNSSANITDALNGTLAGLVVITPAAAFVQPYIALIFGVVSAIIQKGSSALLVRFRIDDPLDASGVHGACGLVGAILLGFFADPILTGRLRADAPAGIFYGGDGTLLAAQLVAGIVVVVWSGIVSFAVFRMMTYLDRGRRQTWFVIMTESTTETLQFGAGGLDKEEHASLGNVSKALEQDHVENISAFGVVESSSSESSSLSRRRAVVSSTASSSTSSSSAASSSTHSSSSSSASPSSNESSARQTASPLSAATSSSSSGKLRNSRRKKKTAVRRRSPDTPLQSIEK